jgi:hypothetical protein
MSIIIDVNLKTLYVSLLFPSVVLIPICEVFCNVYSDVDVELL